MSQLTQILRRVGIWTGVLALQVSVAPSETQSQTQASRAKAVADSITAENLDNRLAVMASGVWNIDGEYKSTRGEYHKLTGYFAYVASTATSIDDGEAAVISMFLEPMAGGESTWFGARLSCWHPKNIQGVRCVAENGANALMDVNFIFKTIPWRGSRVEGEISEPDDKSPAKRFEGRSTPRGTFTLIPPQ